MVQYISNLTLSVRVWGFGSASDWKGGATKASFRFTECWNCVWWGSKVTANHLELAKFSSFWGPYMVPHSKCSFPLSYLCGLSCLWLSWPASKVYVWSYSTHPVRAQVPKHEILWVYISTYKGTFGSKLTSYKSTWTARDTFSPSPAGDISLRSISWSFHKFLAPLFGHTYHNDELFFYRGV